MSERTARIMGLVSIVSLVLVVVLAVGYTRISRRLDDVDKQTDRLVVFVDKLEAEREAPDPQRAEQNAAIAEAVRIVPELRIILCEAFPDVPTCASGG